MAGHRAGVKRDMEEISCALLVPLVNLLCLVFKEMFDPDDLRAYPAQLPNQRHRIIDTPAVSDRVICLHKFSLPVN